MNKNDKNRTLAIGLTGGIGSGKTEVGKLFEELGAHFLQADLIARDLVNTRETIKKQMRSLFGNHVYRGDGALDRQLVAKLIFSDDALQIKINQIVHPPVIDYINREIKTLMKNNVCPVIVVEAALIFEAGVESMFDYTVVVDADQGSRIRRLMKRDDRSREDILKRFRAQIDQSAKVEKADFVITNSGSLELLRQQCEFIYKLFLTMAGPNKTPRSKGTE